MAQNIVVTRVPQKIVIHAGMPGPKGEKGDSAELTQEQFEALVARLKKEVGDLTFATFIHKQDTPLSTWRIQHNLNREIVAVSVYDSTNTEVLGFENTVLDKNTLQLQFNGSFSGKAYIL